jgi:hypothetical protein
MTMKLDKKTGMLILGAVVVLALIFIFYGYFLSLQTNYPNGGSPITQGSTPTYAPAGQLVAGFPPALILDDAARISNSYSVSYSANTNQYTAVWTSSSSMASLFTAYQNYFKQNGWAIGNTFTGRTTLRSVYATKGNIGAEVVIAAQGTASQVTISYATQ